MGRSLSRANEDGSMCLMNVGGKTKTYEEEHFYDEVKGGKFRRE
jgi:hypothetical protein